MLILAGVIALSVVLVACYFLFRKDAQEEHMTRLLAKKEEAERDAEEEEAEPIIPQGRLSRRRHDRERKKEERKEHTNAVVAHANRRLVEEDQRREEQDMAERLREMKLERRLEIISEQKEAKAQAELDEWRAEMSIEEAGEDDDTPDDDNLLARFVDKIKMEKIVYLEQLSADFGMTTERVVLTIEALQSCRRLPGVFDDRGKFIYITSEEYQRVAKFIRQRGRVSIAELSAESSRLVDFAEAASAG
ncbi:DDRGK domain-containing protein 1 [Diplonema papillatum]|nr:DDRGK domain-containing protein 1 [Diplonema papillatum]